MTDLSRRGVIAGSASAAVAGSVLAHGAPATAAPSPPRAVAPKITTNPHLYARSRYAALLGKRFDFTGAGFRTTMVLRSVEDLSGSASGDERHFRLTFRAAAPGPVQATTTVSRKRFEPTSLFVVAADEERRTYVAVVNRGH